MRSHYHSTQQFSFYSSPLHEQYFGHPFQIPYHQILCSHPFFSTILQEHDHKLQDSCSSFSYMSMHRFSDVLGHKKGIYFPCNPPPPKSESVHFSPFLTSFLCLSAFSSLINGHKSSPLPPHHQHLTLVARGTHRTCCFEVLSSLKKVSSSELGSVTAFECAHIVWCQPGSWCSEPLCSVVIDGLYSQ